MNRRVIGIATIAMVAVVFSCFAFGRWDKGPIVNPDWHHVRDGDRVVISGRIRLVGSTWSNTMVLTDKSDKDWYIDDAERDYVAQMEQREVTLSAVIHLESVTFADGTKRTDKRVLTRINVVE